MYKLNRQSRKSSTFQSKPPHSDSLKQLKYTNVNLKSPLLASTRWKLQMDSSNQNQEKRRISQEGGLQRQVLCLIRKHAQVRSQLCLVPLSSGLRTHVCSGSILVCRPSYREPVLTHSCGVQYRNLTPVEINSSVNISDAGNPLQALTRRVFK